MAHVTLGLSSGRAPHPTGMILPTAHAGDVGDLDQAAFWLLSRLGGWYLGLQQCAPRSSFGRYEELRRSLRGARVQPLKQVGGASSAIGDAGQSTRSQGVRRRRGFGDVQRGLEVALLRRHDSALGV
jgi:hypothetical protein